MTPQNTIHGSEDERVIQYPLKFSLTVISLACVILCAVLYFESKSVVGVVIVVPLLLSFAYVSNRQRRLTISKYGVAYRPPIGTAWGAKFADVISIQKAPVLVSSYTRAITDGLLLELSNATAVGIPLDLPNGAEIGDQVIKAWEAQRKG